MALAEDCAVWGRKIRSVGTRHKPRWLHLDVVEGHDWYPAKPGPDAGTTGLPVEMSDWYSGGMMLHPDLPRRLYCAADCDSRRSGQPVTRAGYAAAYGPVAARRDVIL